MKRISSIAAVIGIVGLFTTSMAINGYGVYTLWHDPFVAENPWGPPSYMGTGPAYGPIIGVTITNNHVTKRDTLYRDVGQCPSLSFDGKRVAFFRWSTRITKDNAGYHLVAGTENGPHHISVVDINTKVVTDLIECAKPCGTVRDGDAFMDWPAGDWIYYEKPTESREFWRINAKDPSRNELVCTDNGDVIRRWNLSSDAKYCGMQSNNLGGACKFPFVNNDVSQSDPAGAAACNHAVSTMGNFFGHYFGGNHEWVCIERYDHIGPPNAVSVGSPTAPTPFDNWATHHIGDLEQWMDEKITVPGRGGAEVIKWSVNSEKWCLRMIGMCGQSWDDNGNNTIAINWVDSIAVNMSQIPILPSCGGNPKPTHSGDVGDLWVDFGPGNEHMWEDETGGLHVLAPIDPIGYTPTFTSVRVECPAVVNGTYQPAYANAIVVPGQKVQFTGDALDQQLVKLSTQPTISWSVTGGGTISSTGLFTAGSTIGGPYTVTATATVGGSMKSATGAVTVTGKVAGLRFDRIRRTGASVPDMSIYPFKKRTGWSSGEGTVTAFGLTGIQIDDNLGIRFTGLVDVPADGQYTIYTSADDGSIVWIDNQKVVTTWFTLGERSSTITLTAGLHPIAVDWSQGYGGADLNVSWACASTGLAKQAIPANRLFRAEGGATQEAMSLMPVVHATAGFTVERTGAGHILVVGSMAPRSIKVATATGRVIRSFAIDEHSRRIALGVLAPGVYLVSADNGAMAHTERIMVR